MREPNRTFKSGSILHKVNGLVTKFKNKDKYRNAAYYTLQSDSYSPKFSSLFLCFYGSGLGIVDSAFNAAYMFVCEKHRCSKSRMKRCYGDVVNHPYGYSEECFRTNIWSVLVGVLNFIPKIFSLPSVLSTARKKRRYSGENSFKNIVRKAGYCRRQMSYILPAVMAFAVGIYIYNVSSRPIVLNVSYDGKQIGAVENVKVVNDTLTAVEDTLSQSTGISVKLSNNLVYSMSKQASPAYISANVLYADILAGAKKNYTTAYGLYIDGALVASLENENEIRNVLNEISGENAQIANGVQILKQDYPKDSVKNSQQLLEMLSSYPGDFIMSSESTDTTNTQESAEIMRDIPAAVNPDSVDFSSSYAQENEKKIEISYKTEEYQEKTVAQEYNTIYEYNSNMYSTSKYVKQTGRNGTKKVTEKVVYVDGVEQSRTVVKQVVTKEPVDKIVVKGLKPIPESVPENSQAMLVWPVEAAVNEHFGWRLRDGSYMEYHSGIDMASPRGTPILAAASGVVIKSGNFHNGYGNMVIIKHTDGKETFYAHMNDIYVSQGDIVAQGVIIGEVGSTGDSTGNHIHFEVRLPNGTAVDPIKYLVPRGE